MSGPSIPSRRVSDPTNRRNGIPRPTRRTRGWRINGPDHELIPVGLPASRRFRGARDLCELRRKADDRRVALLCWRGRGEHSAIELLAQRGHEREALEALRALAVEWAAAAPRGRLRIVARTRGFAVDRTPRSTAALHARVRARGPVLERVSLPDDYAERTALPAQPEPPRLALAGHDRFGRATWLREAVARAWARMRDAARADGIELDLVSGFRHVAYQTRLFQRKLARGLTLAEILRVNAAPGFSEHHSGRAIDITTPGSPPAEESFETTPAFAWLTRNAGAHGFRMSYPRGNPHGVGYEPWHWFFVEAKELR